MKRYVALRNGSWYDLYPRLVKATSLYTFHLGSLAADIGLRGLI